MASFTYILIEWYVAELYETWRMHRYKYSRASSELILFKITYYEILITPKGLLERIIQYATDTVDTVYCRCLTLENETKHAK